MSKRNIIILVLGLAGMVGLFVYAQTSSEVSCRATPKNGPTISLNANNSTPLYSSPTWSHIPNEKDITGVSGSASVTSSNRLRWSGSWEIWAGWVKYDMSGSASCKPS